MNTYFGITQNKNVNTLFGTEGGSKQMVITKNYLTDNQYLLKKKKKEKNSLRYWS